MTKKIAALLALVAVAGLAAASALTVKQRQDTVTLHAERYTVGELFVVEGSALAPVPATLGALGVVGSPVEMTAANATARTPLVQDQWMYSVVVREANAGAVTGGQFSVELQLNGQSVGTVLASQNAADATAIEGIRASFGIGPTVDRSSLYYVVVKPYVPLGPTLSYTVRSNPNGNYTWVGVGGSIDGQVGPSIAAALGTTIQMTARNADGIAHNLGFRSGSALVNPPGWSPTITADGEEATLAWTPSAAGTYTYACQFHASMTGTITVT